MTTLTIKLTNTDDLALANRSLLPQAQVRSIEQIFQLADDSSVRVRIAGPEYLDRSTNVVPGASQNLLGVIPLEDMDRVVHPASEELVPAHPEGPVKPIRLTLKQG